MKMIATGEQQKHKARGRQLLHELHELHGLHGLHEGMRA
jgi:hypothetical protein